MTPDDQPAVTAGERGEALVAGFTRSGLAALDTELHALVDAQKLAGVATLVARHGEIVHLDAYGRQDVSTPTPLMTESIFRIASMTKPIIGAAMMMLGEEGRWALDDAVAKHIPEFANLKVKTEDGSLVAQARPMTMRQLMSHTAGFGGLADYAEANLRGGDLRAMIEIIADRPLAYQPGSEWRYGPSVDIQGYVIETLTGQGLDAFLKARLFDPLGMADTGFWVDPAKSARVVRIHNYVDGKIAPAGKENAFNTARPAFLSGGGGLVSTIGDYWRFAQMILNGGEFAGRRYLADATVAMMHRSVLEPGVNVTLYSPEARGLGFGMDFGIIEDPVAAKTSQGVESFYWGGAFGTWFWIDPVNDMIVIGMIQNVSGTTPDGAPMMREISARAVYAAMTDRKSL
jgi:CubicO group peptidase (beta-lactamase class C family)